MKYLDKLLRNWRIKEANQFVRPNDKILDIGCFDGYLFEVLKQKNIQPSIGLDPLLEETKSKGEHLLVSGSFPNDVPTNTSFDCIVMLAVLEHIPREQQQLLNSEFFEFLNPLGRIIITVPSPFVDQILWVLKKLNLVDGMSLDEHYGFKTSEVFSLFDKKKYSLLKHKRFQLGLNNLFVFEKIA
ncbi:class I SAM-dependent methyltransferase [Psychroserpens ponticola]|uniref:Methyltransferase domain-containing protein n=1 Tax=Psychroserpens ponticola TaxID=2932268 RepID=A0ABY7RUM8_9FLAO|nr:methyltransferase domain-containing protein [Psychroserpens ponticola]WCO00839.1 methyltransferase domain-containing protein [Psychroserpens ponticola]